MTVQELMTRVFQLAGEPSDLCPYTVPGDPTTFDVTLGVPGSLPLLGWINQALLRICNWEYPDGTILRFRHLRKSLFFKSRAALVGTASAGGVDTMTIAGFGALNAVNQFSGWVLTITGGTGIGQVRVVVGDTGGNPDVLQVHLDWVTVPDNTSTFSLCKRFFDLVSVPVAGSVTDYGIPINGITQIVDVLKIRDVTTLQDMGRAMRTDLFTATMINKGLPTSFLMEGSRLVFDVPFEGKRAFEIIYYSQPAPLTAITSEVGLGSPFHEAIMLWAVHSLQMRNQDFNGAYATKRDMQELMQTLRNGDEMNMENEQSGMVVWG